MRNPAGGREPCIHTLGPGERPGSLISSKAAGLSVCWPWGDSPLRPRPAAPLSCDEMPHAIGCRGRSTATVHGLAAAAAVLAPMDGMRIMDRNWLGVMLGARLHGPPPQAVGHLVVAVRSSNIVSISIVPVSSGHCLIAQALGHECMRQDSA